MRFKVMHKIYDFEKRFGFPMCVGCGPLRRRLSGVYLLCKCYQSSGKGGSVNENEYIPFSSQVKEIIPHTDIEYTFRMSFPEADRVKPGQFFECPSPNTARLRSQSVVSERIMWI